MGNRRNSQQKRKIKNKGGRYDDMIYNLKIKIYYKNKCSKNTYQVKK